MRVSIKTKKRHLLIATGEDATEAQAVEWVQMTGGDFQVPEYEYEEYESEEDQWIPDEMRSAKAAHSFGFAPRNKPNSL